MKKTVKIFSLIALSAFALTSCIEETFPEDNVATAGQIAASPSALEASLRGIPSQMAQGYLVYGSQTHETDMAYPAYMIAQTELLGDMYPGVSDNTGYDWYKAYNVLSYNMADNSYPSYLSWFTFYKFIKSANDIISAVGDVNAEGLTDYAKGASGVAHACRAFNYYMLTVLFEPKENIYTDCSEVAGLTVPIVDENLDEKGAKNNPRATREEMFKFIFSDLAFAEEALAEYVPTSITNPDLSVVYGLYARAYLWLGGFDDGLSGELPEGNDAYTKAAEYARMAINAHGGAIMNEAEWTSVANGFNVAASSWMWGLQHSVDTVINNLFQFTAHMALEAEYGYAPLSMPGVSSKDYDRLANTDFRKKLMKGPNTTYAEMKPYTSMSEDEWSDMANYVFFKYRPAAGNRTEYKTAGAVTLPLMRCEEMYFIEMEAVAHTQGNDAGWALLNQFMANRDSNYICPTSNVVDEIIFQKGIEFWGEGIKMYDMKRLDKGYEAAYVGTNYPTDARFNLKGRAPWWTYCIPKDETDMNKAAALQGSNPNPSQAFQPITE